MQPDRPASVARAVPGGIELDLGAIVQRMEAAVFVTDATGRITWANPAFERQSGHTLAELLGRTPGSVLQGPQTDPDVATRIRAAFAGGEPLRVEILNVRKGGQPVWVDLDLQPLLDARGSVRGYFGVQTDISAQRAAIERLQREMRLRAGAETAARVGAWWTRIGTGQFDWSPEIFRILRIPSTDVPDKDMERTAFGEAGLQHIVQHVRMAARTGHPFETEIPLPGDDVPRRWIRVYGAPLMKDGVCTEMFGALQDITQEKALEAEVLAAGGRERTQIAVDLHDELGQELTGLRLAIDALRTRALAHGPDLLPDIDRALHWALRAIAATRTLSREMSSLALQNGLGAAILDFAARLPTGRCALEIDPTAEAQLPPASHEDLFRIVQEAVQNAVKHGAALRVTIALRATPGELRLTVKDDGTGFQPGDRPPGIGLTSMRYRAGRIGGMLTLLSAPGEGTEVIVVLPRSG